MVRVTRQPNFFIPILILIIFLFPGSNHSFAENFYPPFEAGHEYFQKYEYKPGSFSFTPRVTGSPAKGIVDIDIGSNYGDNGFILFNEGFMGDFQCNKTGVYKIEWVFEPNIMMNGWSDGIWFLALEGIASVIGMTSVAAKMPTLFKAGMNLKSIYSLYENIKGNTEGFLDVSFNIGIELWDVGSALHYGGVIFSEERRPFFPPWYLVFDARVPTSFPINNDPFTSEVVLIAGHTYNWYWNFEGSLAQTGGTRCWSHFYGQLELKKVRIEFVRSVSNSLAVSLREFANILDPEENIPLQIDVTNTDGAPVTDADLNYTVYQLIPDKAAGDGFREVIVASGTCCYDYQAACYIDSFSAQKQAGIYEVNISAAKSGYLSAECTKSFSVKAKHNPILSEPKVSPSSGNYGDTFEFNIDYFDQDGNPPLPGWCTLFIDGKGPYEMELKTGLPENGTYSYKTSLNIGDHSYYFFYQDDSYEWSMTPIYAGPIVETPPANVTLRAKTSEGGTKIYKDKWQSDNDPYFYWNRPETGSPIVGYSYSIDGTPPDFVNLTTEYYKVPTNALCNGVHYFRVKALDNAGNWGPVEAFEIKVDDEKPTINSEIVINDGDVETTSRVVNISNIYVDDDWSGISQMSFMNGGGSWSPWEQHSASRIGWDLSAYGGSSDYGLKTVFVRCRDAASNISDSKSMSINYVPLIPVIDVKINNNGRIAEWNFGEVPVGASWESPSYAEKTFIVRNDGWVTLEVSHVTIDSAVFAIVPVNGTESSDDWLIPPKTSKDFKVFFTPTAGGGHYGSLILTCNDPVNPSWQISLAGTGIEPAIRVGAQGLDENKVFDFETIDVGDTGSHVFTVYNDGTMDLEITEARFWGDRTSFAVEPKNVWDTTDDWVIPPGDSRDFVLYFTPKVAGDYQTIFDLLTNDPDWNDFNYQIILRGNGVGGVNPVDLKTITTSDAVRSISINNVLVFIIGPAGLQIAAISNPENPSVLSNYATISSASEIFVEGSYAYISEVNGTVEIVNVSDPAHPAYVSHIKVADNARGIVFLDDGRDEFWRPKRLYVACGSEGLKVVDVTEPLNPTILGGVDHYDDFVLDVVLCGSGVNGWSENCLAVIMGNQIYLGHMVNPDVFNAYSVRYLSNPECLHAEGDKLYATDESGLHIFDVTNFENPTLLGSVPKDPAVTSSCFRVSSSGSLVYMSQPSIGVMIIDVTNFEQPSIIGTYEDKNVMGVCGYESLLYVASFDSKWHVVDPQVFSDLVPMGKEYEIYAAKPGGNFETTIIISNLGPIGVPNNLGLQLSAYLSEDSILRAEDNLLLPNLSSFDAVGGNSSLERTWKLNVGTNVPEGEYYLIFELIVPDMVYDRQTSNNLWVSASPVVIIDKTPPALVSLNLDQASDSGMQGDNITKWRVVTIEGKTEPGVTLALKEADHNLGSCVTGSDGKFRFQDVMLTEGVNTFVVKAVDLAGNSVEETFEVNLDPNVTSLWFDLSPYSDSGAIGDYLTKYPVVSIVGTTEPGANVALFCGGEQVGTTTASIVNGDFRFFEVVLKDNDNKVMVEATDSAGNFVSVNHYITVDTHAPPAPSMPVWINTFVFEGYVAEDGILRLYADGVGVGLQTITEGTERYSIAIEPPAEGIQMIFATLEDTAGNCSPVSFTWLSNKSPLPGDIFADLSIDLRDAILSLQLICGVPTEKVNKKANMNGDGKIGLEEVIYILQEVSGLR